jgi:glycosyltransferase involved in cell wall biosynthesis
MRKKKLSDSCRFPGFTPQRAVVGIFGDSCARVIREQDGDLFAYHLRCKFVDKGANHRTLNASLLIGNMHTRTDKLNRTNRLQLRLHDKPVVSIITVVFNGADVLEGTIQSILEQTYDNIEYIIIDGNSTDGTMEIIRKYQDSIANWITEPDRGIYDAMNKGIAMASGEWINFMNAGDTFYQSNTIESIYTTCDPKADIIFGAQELVYPDRFTVVKRTRPLRDVWKGNICWHQSLFVRTALLKHRPFDLSYEICADFDFLLYAFMHKKAFHDSGQIVSKILLGGFSDNNLLRANNEKWRISKKYWHTRRVDPYFILLQLNTICNILVKKILPNKIKNAIISYVNR